MNKQALKALVCEHNLQYFMEKIPGPVLFGCVHCRMVEKEGVDCHTYHCRSPASTIYYDKPWCGTCKSLEMARMGIWNKDYEDPQAKYIRENPPSNAPRQYVKRGHRGN